jgi:hypothetical protein
LVASCGGNHPAACGRHPSTEGIRTRVWTGVVRLLNPYTNAETKFPSWEGWRVAPGWFPRAVRGVTPVLPTSRRSAPSLRSTGTLAIRTMLQVRSNPVPGGQHTSYVPTYRRILRQPWIASPHFINYVSQVRRRLRKDGQGSPAPAHGAGKPPRRRAPEGRV